MAENKTQKSEASVQRFIASIKDAQQKKDSAELVDMMKSLAKEDPRMWGASMVGFGDYHYKYESGREGDIFRIGFAPRKTSLVLYSMGNELSPDTLKKLGKCKMGKGCLYIKKLDDIDRKELKAIMKSVWAGASRKK